MNTTQLFRIVHPVLLFTIVLVCTVVLFCTTKTAFALNSPNEDDKKTNIVLILADDLGFSDLGCFGSEIETPNLDTLAENGLRFSNFYNTGRCWPTRAALLTGYYPQQVGFDLIPGDPPIRRGPRPSWAQLLPQILRDRGYRSYHSGKWHLDGGPVAGGFDRSYSLNDHGRFFSPRRHQLDDKPLDPVKIDSGYYATVSVADYAIEFLKEHQAKHADQPFFEFIAFTAPHFPLHALPKDIEKYKDTYNAGWNQIRRQRSQKIRELKLVNGQLSRVEPDVGPPYRLPDQVAKFGDGEVTLPVPWDQLTEQQKKFQANKMAIHAAMIDRMDQEIGRIIRQLRDMDQFDNTLILFLSDNGASAELMVRDDGHDPDADFGSWKTHLCLGPGWSNACNSPFRRHKTWVHEGGIHTPLIAHWPSRIKNVGKIQKTVGHVIDLVPTVLDLTSEQNMKPGDLESKPKRPGISLLSALTENKHIERDSLWWCHEGNIAYRQGDWKMVKSKGQKHELFNISKDPTEQVDLADSMPEKLDSLKQKWQVQNEQFRELARQQRASGKKK